MGNQTTRVKVLHVITHLAVGGALDNTLLTVKGLSRERYQVDLAAGPLPEEEGYSDWHERSVDSADELISIPDLQRAPHPVADWKAFHQLYKLIKERGYDVVHTHCSKAGVLGRMAARKAKAPVIIHTAHAFGSQVERTDNKSFLRQMMSRMKERTFIQAERYAGSIADRLITVCKQNKQLAIQQKLAKPDQIIPIYSGIDMNRFDVQADRENIFDRFELNPKKPLVVFIGRLAAQKAPLDFVNAAKQVLSKCPETQFIMAGDGPLADDVLTAIRSESRIQCIGFYDQVPELMAVSDVLAVSSLWEGLGRSVTEAMIMGLPVAATAVDGIPELVTHGKTGLLSQPSDPAGLADNLTYLLKNPEKAKSMAQQAQEFVGTRFSSKRMIQSIDDLYCQLLQEKGLISADPMLIEPRPF